MINIRNLLDICGIVYKEDQLIMLEKLLNDMIQKYLKGNCEEVSSCSKNSNEVLVGYAIKQEEFSDYYETDPIEEPNVETNLVIDDSKFSGQTKFAAKI